MSEGTTYLAVWGNQKLFLKLYRSYEVLHRVVEMPYQLALQASSKIHEFIYVSQLKKHLPPRTELEQHDISNEAPYDLALLEPAAIFAVQVHSVRIIGI